MATISTLGQTLDQLTRLDTIQARLEELNRQIATGRKSETFAGLGDDSIISQRLRANVSEIDSYLRNIDLLNPRISITQDVVEESLTQADGVLGSVLFQLQQGEFDDEGLSNFASDTLNVIQDVVNTQINGRYLLAGDSVTSPPYTNAGILQTQTSGFASDFLDGTLTAEDFLTQLDGLTDTELGFSADVQSAGNVFSRIDRDIELDYTARANSDAFRDVIGALSAIENLQFPEEGVDIATEQDFYELLDGLEAKLRRGIDGLQQEFNNLERDRVIVENTRVSLNSERTIFQNQLEGIESVDPSEAIVTFQRLQTQLEASFQATSIIANTSLINFL